MCVCVSSHLSLTSTFHANLMLLEFGKNHVHSFFCSIYRHEMKNYITVRVDGSYNPSASTSKTALALSESKLILSLSMFQWYLYSACHSWSYCACTTENCSSCADLVRPGCNSAHMIVFKLLSSCLNSTVMNGTDPWMIWKIPGTICLKLRNFWERRK